MKINFQVYDYNGNREAWNVMMLFSYLGPLPQDGEMKTLIDEDAVLREAIAEAEANNFYIRECGGGAGRAFATEPCLTIYKEHLTITQSGGLDV